MCIFLVAQGNEYASPREASNASHIQNVKRVANGSEEVPMFVLSRLAALFIAVSILLPTSVLAEYVNRAPLQYKWGSSRSFATAQDAADASCQYRGYSASSVIVNGELYGWYAFHVCKDTNGTPQVSAYQQKNGICPEGSSSFSQPLDNASVTINDGFNTYTWSSNVPSGIVTCRLTTVDPLKPPRPSCPSVGNPLDPATGNKYEEQIIYRAPNKRGLNLTWHYNNHAGQATGFRNWTHTFHTSLVAHPYPVSIKSVEMGDGTVVSFNFVGNIGKSDSDVNLRLVRNVDGNSTVTGWTLVDPDSNEFYIFDPSGAFTKWVGVDGNSSVLVYSDTTTPTTTAPKEGLLIQVRNVFDREINFRYAADGVLTKTLDSLNQPTLYIFELGQLRQVTFADQTTRRYFYNEAAFTQGADIPEALTGLEDEYQFRFASWSYASSGKATGSEHAGGVAKYSISGNNVISPTGATSTFSYLLKNLSKKLYARSQPAGSGCSASTSSADYDINGNATYRNDFNGQRSCYSSDLLRNLETARVEGLAHNATCTTYLATNATLPAGSRKVSNLWHPDWRLNIKTAEPGRITTSVYNGQPDPFNGNAVASCAPSAALLPDGKPIVVLCKKVEQATTDTDGRLGLSAALQSGVANRVWQWTYNQWGQVLTEKDPLNNTTASVYYADTVFTGADPNAVGHTKGDLHTVTNAKGHQTRYTKYDKHGQVLEMIDPNGVVTTNTYDLRQRLLSTTVGGQQTSYAYDPAGQLKRVTQPDASWIGYEYDDAHRQTAVLDNLGNRIEYTLDNAGNRTAENVKDSGGTLRRQLARSIDALGRVQQTTGRE